jgi:hypothetical protein
MSEFRCPWKLHVAVGLRFRNKTVQLVSTKYFILQRNFVIRSEILITCVCLSNSLRLHT